MPIYEYECPACGARFELRQGINGNDNDIKCPKCKAPGPRRILSMFSTGSSGGTCTPSGST
jgi:putative FmdB family regulatory protein